MSRKFELIKDYNNAKLPQRSTEFSAGYDFFAIEEVFVPSLFTTDANNKAKEKIDQIEELWNNDIVRYAQYMDLLKEALDDIDDYSSNYAPVMVKTGVKAKFPEDEALFLFNRSSNPKRGLYLANGTGIVDSDYYNNDNNEGHIMFAFINLGQDDYVINPGDRIGQGVFMNFKLVDGDTAKGKRDGGFGSTGGN